MSTQTTKQFDPPVLPSMTLSELEMHRRLALGVRLHLLELQALPTIDQGHFDNLKFDNGVYRVWLSRMTKDDGAVYDNGVTVEKIISGVWTPIRDYPAR